jgi:hypothetical protein
VRDVHCKVRYSSLASCHRSEGNVVLSGLFQREIAQRLGKFEIVAGSGPLILLFGRHNEVNHVKLPILLGMVPDLTSHMPDQKVPVYLIKIDDPLYLNYTAPHTNHTL